MLVTSKSNEMVDSERSQLREYIAEAKRKIDSLLAVLDSKFRQFLRDQQKQFDFCFQEQLALIKLNFDELHELVQSHIANESRDNRMKHLARERNFFQEHALFLNDQHERVLKELRALKVQFEIQKDESKTYRELYNQLKNRSLFVRKDRPNLDDDITQSMRQDCYLTQPKPETEKSVGVRLRVKPESAFQMRAPLAKERGNSKPRWVSAVRIR